MEFVLGLLFGVLIVVFTVWFLSQLPAVLTNESQDNACVLAEQYKRLSEFLNEQALKLFEKCRKAKEAKTEKDKKEITESASNKTDIQPNSTSA